MEFLRRLLGRGRKQAEPDLTPPLLPRVPRSGVAGVTRQLPEMDSIQRGDNLRLVVALSSDVGAKRNNNEDALLGWMTETSSIFDLPTAGIFILADGMGGHAGGERAAALTISQMGAYLATEILVRALQNNKDMERKSMLHVLAKAVDSANATINEEVPDAGTTCTAAVILADTLYIAHIGDSRAYLIYDDEIEKITRDHSMAGRLIEIGQMTEDVARSSQERHTLYKALGKGSVHEPDLLTRTLEPGSWLLLCSDGLWEPVSDGAMLDIVLHAPSPHAACDQLVALANQNSGDDNISAILVQIQ